MKQLELLVDYKLVQPLWKTVWQCLLKLDICTGRVQQFYSGILPTAVQILVD